MDPSTISDQPSTIPGLSPADMARHQQRHAELTAANDEPLPGPLAEALDPTPITVCGITLYPITPGHVQAMALIDHPLRKITKGLAAEYTFDDILTGAYILSLPPAAARAQARIGLASFLEAAYVAIGDRISPAVIPQLTLAIAQILKIGTSTAIGYTAKQLPGEPVVKGPCHPMTA